MAKVKDLEAWGRSKAKERYAEGGGVQDEEVGDRPSEVDAFIKAVMREQLSKMDSAKSAPEAETGEE